jgi:hypothetical protein
MWKGENFGVGPPEKYVLNDSGIMDGYIIHPFKLFSTFLFHGNLKVYDFYAQCIDIIFN